MPALTAHCDHLESFETHSVLVPESLRGSDLIVLHWDLGGSVFKGSLVFAMCGQGWEPPG